MRLVISTINSPTKFLEQNFNLILKDSLTFSKNCIKNSWEIQNIIIKKTVPDDCIMVSKRWDKIKLRTRLSKKEFLKGIDFIMNSTYFKFNGKFYKQKFGTPIGSVISPVLAEMVMEDLEEFFFLNLILNCLSILDM